MDTDLLLTYAPVLVIGVAAGLVSGIVGTGATVILLPILVLSFGPKSAIPIMAIVALMSNFAKITSWWKEIDWRAAGAYALSWQAHGLGYGIPADIAADLAAGRVVIANVSRSVLAEAASRHPTRVLLVTAPAEVLAHRLAARGREDAADIARRLSREAPLPDGLDVVTVMNDTTPADGVAQFLAALRGSVG